METNSIRLDSCDSIVKKTNCRNTTVFQSCFSFSLIPSWYILARVSFCFICLWLKLSQCNIFFFFSIYSCVQHKYGEKISTLVFTFFSGEIFIAGFSAIPIQITEFQTFTRIYISHFVRIQRMHDKKPSFNLKHNLVIELCGLHIIYPKICTENYWTGPN